MTLVAYTGWLCLSCGHRAERLVPCCERRLAIQVLVDEPERPAASR